MILLVDNFDSFTYNLVDYFYQLGQPCTIVRNDVSLSEIVNIAFDSIVLSPGPGVPSASGGLMHILDQYHREKPVLGICLGHQAICEYFGGSVRKALKPMHGKVSKITRRDDALFAGLPDYFNVVRYHSLVGYRLPEVLQVLAETDEGEIMALRHTDFPIWGIQFHPEAALTEYGIQVLRNWLKSTNQLS